jgi:hypothetical protein
VVAPPIVEKPRAAPVPLAPAIVPPLVPPPIVAREKLSESSSLKPSTSRKKSESEEEFELETTTHTSWRRKPLDEFARIEFGHVSPPLEDEEMEAVVERVTSRRKAKSPSKLKKDAFETEAEPEHVRRAEIPAESPIPRLRSTEQDDESLYGILPAHADEALEDEREEIEAANDELSRLYQLADHEFGVNRDGETEVSSETPHDVSEYAELDEDEAGEEDAEYDNEEYEIDFDDESEAA